jgi:hypothetical protein
LEIDKNVWKGYFDDLKQSEQERHKRYIESRKNNYQIRLSNHSEPLKHGGTLSNKSTRRGDR